MSEFELTGFDPAGEPSVSLQDDALHLEVQMMPPSWGEGGDAPWDDFATLLQAAIGAEVYWEDRELFVIPISLEDVPATVQKIQGFLTNFRAQHDSAALAPNSPRP